ncbi:MAG: SDR family NAD(P)-dependent oxidoreductase [Gammaproteobacteria bacterium]|nr:SDR family NAD(P)-dependent oxidoreductase [Gammaproteobacteria bacterium]MBT4493021.1 SDR family NAD(P)-dependent oxidoreductase [Gammaproteobacteria bacterium]MBT7372168.1 SDR family NAD(P)-dependent oxidoreductase [Gammaproteobacteria bacterium]
MAAFGSQTTTDEVLKGIDLTGKIAIVTGASGGLGAETARALASKGCSVTIAARDLSRAEAMAAEIRTSTGNDSIDVGELELDKPDSVRRFASNYLANHDSLNILINNAGVMACPLDRTAEGWEMQFATNHLGHFLLTCLLSPALVNGAPARVVNLSSGGHNFGPIDFDDIHFNHRDYDKFASYGQSKSANILFSIELDNRLKDRGVRANAVHPGVIVTDLGRHMTQEDIEAITGNRPEGSPPMEYKEVPAGAATSVWLATSPELEGTGGQYAQDCQLVAPDGPEAGTGGWASWAQGDDNAARLWTLSEGMLGETFNI